MAPFVVPQVCCLTIPIKNTLNNLSDVHNWKQGKFSKVSTKIMDKQCMKDPKTKLKKALIDL